jgi:hypothetical protein
MPTVRVNIFEGPHSQISRMSNVSAGTYQDVVSALINNGEFSGQIYSIQGEVIDYNAPITLPEINYIIPSGDAMGDLFVRTLLGRTYSVNNIKKNGTVRDIYNNVVAQGMTPNSKIIIAGAAVSLDDPLSNLELNRLPVIHVIALIT